MSTVEGGWFNYRNSLSKFWRDCWLTSLDFRFRFTYNAFDRPQKRKKEKEKRFQFSASKSKELEDGTQMVYISWFLVIIKNQKVKILKKK